MEHLTSVPELGYDFNRQTLLATAVYGAIAGAKISNARKTSE
jgi:hypothetical protein